MREISDPLSWSACFLAFMVVKEDHKETRDLAAYGMLILHLARKHTGSGWLVYDHQFRQHQAAGANLPRANISSSLMAATVLSRAGSGPGHSCSLCLAADHTQDDCALAPLKSHSTHSPHSALQPNYSSRQSCRLAPYSSSDNICRRFNRGYCGSSNCRYDHVCSECYKQGHPESQCSESKAKARARPDDAKVGGPHRSTFPLGEVNDLLHNSVTYDTVHPAQLYSQPIVHVIISSYSLLYHLTTAATMKTMSSMTHLITYFTPAATLKDLFVKVRVPSRSPSPSP